jgi:hypothetical protein
MFLIYINDIGEKLISLSRLFADDTSLGYSSQSVDKIKTVINHDLLELNAWSSKCLMSFNPEKTEILFFSNTGNIDNIEFSFNGKSIPYLLVISIWELSSPNMQNGMKFRKYDNKYNQTFRYITEIKIQSK